MGCGASAGTKKPPDPPADDPAKKADRSEDKKAAQLENKDTAASVFLFRLLSYVVVVPMQKQCGVLGGGRCFSFGGTVQYIEESNIYLCFVVCRLKRGLVT